MTHESASDFLAGECLDEAALVELIDKDGRKSPALEHLLQLGEVHGTNFERDRGDVWYGSVELRNAPEWAVRVFDALDPAIRDALADEETERLRDREYRNRNGA